VAAADKSGGALPLKLAALLREAKWLLLVGAAAYLVLIFGTFERADPGWSHTATGAATRNSGGVVGAYLADILLYLFGVSAWWFVALCAYIVVWGYRGLDGKPLVDKRPLWLAFAGFAVLLLASTGLEGLRLHSLTVTLPNAPGGLVGYGMAKLAGGALGFTGGTLALLTLFAVGLSLFTGVSWLAVSEWVGVALEALHGAVMRAWERRQDRKAGDIAREERAVVVQTEKKREEDHPPLRIEPQLVEIKKSERVQKEKQAKLFDNLPDTPLPPLKLLDEAKHDAGETVSAETVEFNSRLIATKRSDFGVAV